MAATQVMRRMEPTSSATRPTTWRLPQAIVKLNVQTDTREIRSRSSGSDYKKTEFPLNGLTPDVIGGLYDGNIAFVMLHRVENYTSTRDHFGNSVRVPAMATLNGIDSDSLEEVKTLIEPLGIIEMGNQLNDAEETNAIVGGALSVPYSGIEPVRLNGYIKCFAPNKEERQKMTSIYNNEGSDGRITLMMGEYNPLTEDFSSPECFLYHTQPGRDTAIGKAYRQFILASLKLSGDNTPLEDKILEHRNNILRPTTKNEELSALNEALRAFATLKLDKERWVKWQAEQPIGVGEVAPIHAVSYAL